MKYEFGASHSDASSTLAQKYLFTFRRNTILNSYLNRIKYLLTQVNYDNNIISLFYTKFLYKNSTYYMILIVCLRYVSMKKHQSGKSRIRQSRYDGSSEVPTCVFT